MILDERVLGTTRMLALIGNPVSHTISPLIHNTLSKTLGKNLIYVPFKVEKNRLDEVIASFKELGVVGFNVTVPFKRDIMRFIDENSREAILMGAVNTVKIVNGKLYGYNTDAEGFARSFKEETGTDFYNKNIFVLGAGGAARAITVKLAQEGAKQIYIVNRTHTAAEELAELVNTHVDRIVKAVDIGHPALTQMMHDSHVIMNTTQVGMAPNTEELPIENLSGLHASHIVYDVIYNPMETRFLKEAKNRGATIVNGFGMLMYQGILAYEIWTGTKISEELTQELSEKLIKYLL